MTTPQTTAQARAAREQAHARALTLLREGKRELAMQRYVAILADDPTDADALFYCAIIAIQEQQVPEGIRIIERAFEVGPPRARLHNLLGQAYLLQGRKSDALLSFERAIICEPDFADAYGNRGNVLADLGRHEEALAALEQALELRPDNVEDLHNRAALLAELGRFEEALAGCETVVAARADFAPALRLRDALRQRLNRPA